jgi:hypothetical protein
MALLLNPFEKLSPMEILIRERNSAERHDAIKVHNKVFPLTRKQK